MLNYQSVNILYTHARPWNMEVHHEASDERLTWHHLTWPLQIRKCLSPTRDHTQRPKSINSSVSQCLFDSLCWSSSLLTCPWKVIKPPSLGWGLAFWRSKAPSLGWGLAFWRSKAHCCALQIPGLVTETMLNPLFLVYIVLMYVVSILDCPFTDSHQENHQSLGTGLHISFDYPELIRGRRP